MSNLPRLLAVFVIGTVSALSLRALPGPVEYNPLIKIIQGQQPFTASYTLTVTAPAGSTLQQWPATVTVEFTVANKPATVSTGDAMTFITASPAQLTFPAAGTKAQTVITVSVPLGSYTGDYAWKIRTVGWAADSGAGEAAVNATVSPPTPPDSPLPSVSILSPADLATGISSPGSPASFPIQFTAIVPPGGQPLQTLGALFDSQPLALTTSIAPGGMSATGSGSTGPITTAGSHTIRVFAQNAAGTAFQQVTVLVTSTEPPPPPPFCADVEWLPPVSHDRAIKGGSLIPIKFRLHCEQQKKSFVRDTDLLIAIYEIVGRDETNAQHYLYGSGSPNPPDYAINGNHYHLNFRTAAGAHEYLIKVFHVMPNGDRVLLGTKTLLTSAKGVAVD